MKDIGLVLGQHTPFVAHQPLISGIEHGLEEILVRSDMRLATRIVRDRAAELDVYRYWHEVGAVDAVVLVTFTRKDERVRHLNKLGVPFIAIADERQIGDYSAVAIDNAGMMQELVEHLVSRGHTSIVYVSGPADGELSAIRATAFREEAARLGFLAAVVNCEQTDEAARSATREIFGEDDRPTAVIYDDDVTAAAGLETIQSLGLAVPADVAVIAWNDSVLCQSSIPPITAMSNEAHNIGLLAGECLIQTTLQPENRTVLHAPKSFIVERAST